jgi:hypothetical protein
MTGASRLKKFRARQREGKIVLHIEVDSFEHTQMLIAAGLLDGEWSENDRRAIEEATEKLLRTFSVEDDA